VFEEESTNDAMNELVEKMGIPGTLEDRLLYLAKEQLVKQNIVLPKNETIALPNVGSEHRNVLMVFLCKSPAAESEKTLSPVKNKDSLPKSLEKIMSWIEPRTSKEFIFCDAFPHKTSGIRKNKNVRPKNLKVTSSDFEFAKWWLELLIKEYSISIVVAFGSQTSYVVHSLLCPDFKFVPTHLSTKGNYQFSQAVALTQQSNDKMGVTGFYFPHPNTQGLEEKEFKQLWIKVTALCQQKKDELICKLIEVG